MRRLSTYIVGLAPASFSVLVGAVAGVLQGTPLFFVGSTDSTHRHIGQFVFLAITSALWWTAVLLLWWVAVRRRRWTIWKTAGHVTVGLALATMLDMALAAVVASIETKGVFAEAVARAPLMFASSNLVIACIRTPLWFFGSAILVALGRHLIGGENLIVPSPSPASHRDAAI